MKNRTLLLLSLSLAIYSCQDKKDPIPSANQVLVQSDFQTTVDGWTAEYTDYSPVHEDIIEFKSGHQPLPAPLDKTKKSFMLSGQNRSDDLFMFIKKKITGLQPNITYKLLFEIELASKYATNSFGIGGSPGSSVVLKVGASPIEPTKVKKGDYYDLNWDKGDFISGGKDLFVIGHVGIGDDLDQYTLIQRTNKEKIFTVKTTDSGELWLLVGSDSGFEGLTTLYYTSVKVSTR